MSVHLLDPTMPTIALALLIGGALLPAAPTQEQAVPPPEGVTRREAGAFEGYTLISPLLSRSSHLVDMDGEVVHSWHGSNAPAGGVYLLDQGRLLRPQREDQNPRFRGGGIGGRLMLLDQDGKVLWNWVLANEDQTHHHDVEPLPNGNLLLVAWEHRYREDAIAKGRDPKAIDDRGIWPDAVLEVRPLPPDDAEIVWEWHVWDHLIQDFDPRQEGYGSVPDHPERVDINGDHRDRPPETEAERRARHEREREMRSLGYTGGDDDEPFSTGRFRPDWLHTNSVDYHPTEKLIVLCTPNLGELWVIDHSITSEQAAFEDGGRFGKGGGILWRWGNPRMYGRGTDADKRLFFQHDPQWVLDAPPGELRLTVFNNGQGRPGGDHSSVDELVLPYHPERGFHRERGKAYGPAEPVWSYADPGNFYSGFISGAQRLPNGNTLVCEGAKGRVFEVTREGRIVWEYWNPHGGDVPNTEQSGTAPPRALFRATRIAKDDPALAGLIPPRAR